MINDFTEYLQAKDLSNTTQVVYSRYLNDFLKWYNKTDISQTTKADILNYLGYLKTTKKQQNITRRNSLIALNHYFTFLMDKELILRNPTALIKIRGTQKKTLYNIYTFEELTQLADDYYINFIQNYNDNHIPKNQRKQSNLSKQRNYLMLSFLLLQGLVTSDLQKIHLTDIDYQKATVKITGGKKSNDKTLPLNASQIGALMHYIQNVRPQIVEYHTNQDTTQLFLTLPESGRTKANQNPKTGTQGIIKNLSTQVKSLDTKFVNFKQTRASTITHWIKTVGLRKAQYYAGHRYISTTERYLPNDLQSLTEDITKFNPF